MTKDQETEKLRARVDELERHLNIIVDIIKPVESIKDLTIFFRNEEYFKKGLEMSEIKPIDLDALPKVWAWHFDYKKDFAVQGCLMQNIGDGFQVLWKRGGDYIVHDFNYISETDPRIKTPKMRVMTAEELNDIYWEFGKDFRFKMPIAEDIVQIDFRVKDVNLKNCEYSTDRGKTWAKCEVAE